MGDVVAELLAGIGRAPDRLAKRVVALVAYERSHVNPDLRVVRQAQTPSSERQNLRDPRATLQQHAQDDGFASWSVIDHVAHPCQDRQACGFRVEGDRRLKRLHSHLEEPDRLAGRVSTRFGTDASMFWRSSVADPPAMLRAPSDQDL